MPFAFDLSLPLLDRFAANLLRKGDGFEVSLDDVERFGIPSAHAARIKPDPPKSGGGFWQRRLQDPAPRTGYGHRLEEHFEDGYRDNQVKRLFEPDASRLGSFVSGR